MKKVNTTLVLGVIILLLLITGFIGFNIYEGKLNKSDMAYRKLVIANDTLVKINETQYRKLVADTLTQRELNKIVKELGIALEAKPKIVYKTKIVIKEIEKPTDSVSIKGDSISIVDYYPQKTDYFVKYENVITVKDTTGISKFSFNPVDISIVISQREDGVFESDIKVPEFMTVGNVDIQSVPMSIPKVKNFGMLFGVGLGKSFKDQETYLKLSGGVRYKKFYIDVGGGTNGTLDGLIKFEF